MILYISHEQESKEDSACDFAPNLINTIECRGIQNTYQAWENFLPLLSRFAYNIMVIGLSTFSSRRKDKKYISLKINFFHYCFAAKRKTQIVNDNIESIFQFPFYISFQILSSLSLVISTFSFHTEYFCHWSILLWLVLNKKQQCNHKMIEIKY